MVARNEESFLRACIESAQPVVDEVIVVDLESTDRTAEIARGAGARVLRCLWPGDLGAAFNLPLGHVRGDWILSLKPDEVLDPASRHRVRELVNSGAADAYLLALRDYHYAATILKSRVTDPTDLMTRGAQSYTSTRVLRLFRRWNSYRFSGRLNPTVQPAILEHDGHISQADVLIHGYGTLRGDRSQRVVYSALARSQVASEPFNPRNWIDLGLILLKEHRLPAAVDAFRKARSLGLRSEASFLLGAALIGMTYPAAAITFLETAIAGNRRDNSKYFDVADAFELLGVAHESLGSRRKAEAAFRRTIELRPDSVVALNKLAALGVERGAFARAKPLLGRLLALYPGSDSCWVTVGNLQLGRGYSKGACRAYLTALEINPRNLAAQINLGLAYERAGRKRKAVQAYASAAEFWGGEPLRKLRLSRDLLARCTVPERSPLRVLGPDGVVSYNPLLDGGTGRVLVDVVRALRGRPQLALCLDAGVHTGEGLRAELKAMGIEVRTVASADEVRCVLDQVQPGWVLHHWWNTTGLRRTGAERWVAVGHAALPMPLGYDEYVVGSEFHDRFQKHLPPDRIHRIPNGVDLARFRRRQRSNQPVTIAMLSRLHPAKFPRHLTAYLPSLAEVGAQLLVAGRGARRFEIELELEQRGLRKVVRFLGPIRPDQVPDFLGSADIGLHLTETHEEVCSMTILEMLASGLPIVAEPKGCLPEMVVAGVNGFLNSNPEGVAESLRRLIASRALRRRMGEASRRIAASYSMTRFRASWRELISSAPRPASWPPARPPAALSESFSPGRSAMRARVQQEARVFAWKPRISVLICATPRSGCEGLCDTLSNTGLAGQPQEFFDPSITRCLVGGGTEGFDGYLARVFEEGSTPNGVFTAAIRLEHVPELLAQLGSPSGRKQLNRPEALWTAFPGLRFVWTTRRDRLRQAIACSVCRRSAAPGNLACTGAKPKLDAQGVQQCVAAIEAQERAWRSFFESCNAKPVTVFYEDLARDPERTARRVLKQLGIAAPRVLWHGNGQVRYEDDGVPEAWVRQLRDRASSVSRRIGRRK